MSMSATVIRTIVAENSLEFEHYDACAYTMRMNAPPQKAPAVSGKKTATNVSLDAALVAEAKALQVSISQASNRGLEEAVKEARAEQWLSENQSALDSYNDWVEANGLPLEKHRLF
jgi:antitoxin CcdA